MVLDDLLQSFEKTEKDKHLSVGDERIVFVHDSCVRQRGQVYSFRDDEYYILNALLNKTQMVATEYQFVPAMKELGVSEKDVTTELIHKNRPLVEASLEEIEPTLIFVLGNLAMKTILKKSGITNKRGKEFWIDIGEESVPVVPVFHPFSLYSEPKLRGLFIQDIENAYDKFILGKNKLSQSSYKLHNNVDLVLEAIKNVYNYDVIAVDLETTGLDFKKDSILTIGIAVDEKDAFVIPVDHRESELSEQDFGLIREELRKLFATPEVAKVMHNCKFDIKFLKNWGVQDFSNIHDTQIMHSLVNENLPHGLMDLVKEYFPHELEKF